jgi:hypothetical protein
MTKFGFWEYTCPGSGKASRYSLQDWEKLLDDMASCGMNSLSLVIKWITTGYNSSFKWLDKNEESSVISSGNEVLHRTIEMAHSRNIEVWLTAVCSHYQVKEFGIVPPDGRTERSFYYDPDYPGVLERTCLMFGEIAELFGKEADGIVVEIESVEFDWPHRIPIYNRWAEENKRPSYGEIKLQHMDARAYQKHHWRDFLTWRRCVAMQEIEKTVREKGFNGRLAMICETSNEYGTYTQAVNLDQYRKSMPGWAAVTYDYNRGLNRWAGADFSIEQPKRAGLDVYYLGRGIMTWEKRHLTIPLEENWRIDLEDVMRFQPNGFWFFGIDADEKPNAHSEISLLKEMGFSDGLSARKRLIEIFRETIRNSAL